MTLCIYKKERDFMKGMPALCGVTRTPRAGRGRSGRGRARGPRAAAGAPSASLGCPAS